MNRRADNLTEPLKKPSLGVAVIPLVAMAILLGVGFGVYRIHPQILLVAAAFITACLGIFLGLSWRDMEEGILSTTNRAMPAILILLSVGILIGAWIAEWKPPRFSSSGIRLITSAIRRNTTQCVDSKIHHNNLINNILAKIEANAVGMDEAIMLDIHGFASETNSTSVFFVKRGELLTPHADACLPGITRQEVIDIARGEGFSVHERNISISEVYSSDEMFCTGTVGELTPVLEVDGRIIGSGKPGPMTERLREVYRQRTAEEGESLPF